MYSLNIVDFSSPEVEGTALLKIRAYRKGQDEEVYVRIFNASLADYEDIRKMRVEEMRNWQESRYFDADGTFIAEWNGEPAGVVEARVDKLREEKKGFLQTLGVLPEFRKRGIGRRLAEAGMQSLKQRGMLVAETWTQADKQGCMRVFQDLSFKQVRATCIMKMSLEDVPPGIGENTDVTIRDMQMEGEGDLALLNQLDNEAFRDHYSFRPKTLEETKYDLFEIPWFNEQKWFFAVLDGSEVGFACAAVDSRLNTEKNVRWGWVYDIGVLKPHRRRGVGARLMIHSLQLLKSLGMEEALLYVDEMNPAGAVKLYEKIGFSPFKRNLLLQAKLA